MKQKFRLFVLLLLVLFAFVPKVFAEEKVLYYQDIPNMIFEGGVPTGIPVIVGDKDQIVPDSLSVLADMRYAFRYEVADPTIFSIDAKGNWQALREGKTTLRIYGQTPGSSPEFEAELDAHGIQRGEFTTAALPREYQIEVIQILRLPVYRLRHKKTGHYTYTTSKAEIAHFQTWGWVNEGVAWMTKDRFGQPVYRAYHVKEGSYFFTANRGEYDFRIANGWRGEGVAFLSSGLVPVERYERKGQVIYTKDEAEKDRLSAQGYHYIGVAWYAQQ